ncbi:hypothetical protein DVH05_027483 [Phytophthora capsici]|nr:hypothetical protein DVH05_027483 [Phytophthora capsici]|eukprot:jgi/Phyca11/120691/e_gw1.42.371.1
MKFFVFAAAILAAITCTSSAVEDSCVLIDFTTEEAEFTALNKAIKEPIAGKLLGSVLGKYDPLVRSDIRLRGFNYSAFGQDLTISTAIDSINITGLANFAPQYINVTSPNSVGIATNSAGQVHVDTTMTATLVEMEKAATVHLQFVLEQPTIAADIEANMYACSPGVSESLCSNVTIASLQKQLKSATRKRDYANIMKELLMKFKDASVKAFELDFESISDFDLSFDSSSFVFRTLLRLVPNYSAEEINKMMETDDTYLATINNRALTPLNGLINSIIEPLFGATCLSEK